jgi:SAM-dependent methyltransferase
MPHDVSVHEQRDRAESFGAVAAEYDRFRPGYPDALIDDLVALGPGRVLDVGCGTGKAARLLTARGLPVLGVELDPKMAAVARTHGIEVEVAGFEQWDAAGRTFDLVVSGQAWHWVDPAIGAPKLAGLLNPGGVAALFWNFEEDIDKATQTVLDDVYRRLAPELIEPGRKPDDTTHVKQLEASGPFGDVRVQIYPGRKSLSIDHFVGKLGTQSDHLLLGPERLAAVQAALRTGLRTALGGADVVITGGTYTIWARP